MINSVELLFIPIQNGDDTTYKVLAIIQKAKNRFIILGSLPSATGVFDAYNQWQESYQALLHELHPLVFLPLPVIPNITQAILDENTMNLRQNLNNWLIYPDFIPINNKMWGVFNQQDEILLIVKTDDENLSKVPFHLWNFFNYFRKTVLILSNLENN
ncbi:MAG TPA: hypothetical protein V6C58_13215 [Allocoleopsis sp.]